jgi:tRNA (Thr-GGU) A37 N-methylase
LVLSGTIRATPDDTWSGRSILSESYEIQTIGRVESSLTELLFAPKQDDEGAPDAWLVFEPAYLDGLEGIQPGDEVIVLTW